MSYDQLMNELSKRSKFAHQIAESKHSLVNAFMNDLGISDRGELLEVVASYGRGEPRPCADYTKAFIAADLFIDENLELNQVWQWYVAERKMLP